MEFIYMVLSESILVYSLSSPSSLLDMFAVNLDSIICIPNSKRTIEDLCPVSYVFFDNLCIWKNLICILAVDILTI